MFTALPSSAMPKISILLIIISVIIGIVSWHENEKRYTRMYYDKKERQQT